MGALLFKKNKQAKKLKNNLGFQNECRLRGGWGLLTGNEWLNCTPVSSHIVSLMLPRLLGGRQSTLMKRSLKEQRPLLQAERQCNVSNRWFVWMSLDVRDLVFSSSLWNVCVRLWSKRIYSFVCADTQEEEGWAHFFSKNGAFTLRAKCTAGGRCTVSSCLDLTTNN